MLLRTTSVSPWTPTWPPLVMTRSLSGGSSVSPVFLTTHVDRSEKALLKGRAGTILGWELDPEEPPPPRDRDHHLLHLPKCVYVKFEDEVDGETVEPAWSVPGLERGVYCVTPKPEYWCLDKHGAKKKRIRRYQLPLAPGFARTAYSLSLIHI